MQKNDEGRGSQEERRGRGEQNRPVQNERRNEFPGVKTMWDLGPANPFYDYTHARACATRTHKCMHAHTHSLITQHALSLIIKSTFLQDATIHGSEENLSVYELVERGNLSGVNEHQAPGKNCFSTKKTTT